MFLLILVGRRAGGPTFPTLVIMSHSAAAKKEEVVSINLFRRDGAHIKSTRFPFVFLRVYASLVVCAEMYATLCTN